MGGAFSRGVEVGQSSSSSSRGASSSSTSSTLVVSRRRFADSWSLSTIASDCRMPMCSSLLLAIAMQTKHSLPFQSTPSGNCRKASAARWMCSRLASVPWGIAKPSPMYVETDCSRSRIASAYSVSAAPISTSTAPHWRSASSLSVALRPRRTASALSTWAVLSGPTSGLKGAAVLDRVLHLGEGRVAHEDLERYDDGVGVDPARSVGEAGMTEHHLGVRRDLVDGGVDDVDVVLLQLLLHGAGDHHAATHTGVAGDDDLGHVRAVDRCHPLNLLCLGPWSRPPTPRPWSGRCRSCHSRRPRHGRSGTALR